MTWIRRGETGGRHRIYVDHVVDGLDELCDETLQRERWHGHPLPSPSEAWEQVFDDSGLSLVLNSPNGAELLGPRLAAAFETLDQALRDLGDLDRPIEQVIEDPSMTIVRSAAARALALVREQVAL